MFRENFLLGLPGWQHLSPTIGCSAYTKSIGKPLWAQSPDLTIGSNAMTHANSIYSSIQGPLQYSSVPYPHVKTRWSPRTRMLTRMLMVRMSKHMVMQWRTIPFCNRLFEQSCTCFPCCQSAVWSGKCRVWSVECEVRSVECKVWSGECRVCKV